MIFANTLTCDNMTLEMLVVYDSWMLANQGSHSWRYYRSAIVKLSALMRDQNSGFTVKQAFGLFR